MNLFGRNPLMERFGALSFQHPTPNPQTADNKNVMERETGIEPATFSLGN